MKVKVNGKWYPMKSEDSKYIWISSFIQDIDTRVFKWAIQAVKIGKVIFTRKEGKGK